MGKIYKIVNSVNSKIYVGKTTKSLDYRFNRHLINVNKKINRYLYDSINYHGKDKFTIELIEECDDNQLNDRKKYWILYYKSNEKEFGYNMTDGGDGGKMPLESIEKMKLKKRGYKTSEETKLKQSLSHKGKHVGDLNIAKKTEVRKKISETLKEKYRNGELINTLQSNIINSGKKLGFNSNHSDITKEKLSKFRKGKSLEEICGIDNAKRIKNKQKLNFLADKNPKYINIDPNEILILLKQGKNNLQIAKELKVSAATIIDKFKRKFGVTPQQYIKQILYEETCNNTKDN